MPVFCYVCDCCGNSKEKIAKFNDIELCQCGKQMRKGVTKAAFELRGSGWYKDGYSK